MGDTSAIEDIADKLEAAGTMFAPGDRKDGGSQFINDVNEITGEDPDMTADAADGRYQVPAYVEEQIHVNKPAPREEHGASSNFYRQFTGHRSAQF